MKNVAIGRTIYFFPNKIESIDEETSQIEVYPAVVVRSNEESLDLNVFTVNDEKPMSVFLNVAHKSNVENAGTPYWYFMPEI